MNIVVASDHAGLDLKEKLKSKLSHHNWIDVGTHTTDSVDYPDFADLAIQRGDEYLNHRNGLILLICGSGQGMAIRANKHPKVRAALCWSKEVSRLAREHNDANVLCIGARLISVESAIEIINEFIDTKFLEGRHTQRVLKLSKTERLK